MRYAALILLLIAGCSHSPGYKRPIPPYAILTSLPENDPRMDPIREFAEFRHARIYRFRELRSMHADLVDFDPMYVAFVVPPEQITVEFARAAFELCAGIDEDPFVDCCYGFIPARDVASLKRFVKNAKAQEAKLERRLTRAVDVEPAAAPMTRLGWADGLPVKTVAPGAKKEIEDTDYLFIGTSFAVPEDLDLQSIVAFSAVPKSATGPFADALFKQGLYALVAPLGDDPPSLARAEFENAILVNEPLGVGLKAGQDLDALRGKVGTRVLIGDPMIHPFRRDDVKPPLAEVSRFEKRGPRGEVVEVCKYQVIDPNAPGTFAEDLLGPKPQQKLYVRIPLRTRFAEAKLVEPAGARIVLQAVEEWRGERILHVLVVGDSLAVKGLVLTLEVTPR